MAGRSVLLEQGIDGRLCPLESEQIVDRGLSCKRVAHVDAPELLHQVSNLLQYLRSQWPIRRHLVVAACASAVPIITLHLMVTLFCAWCKQAV